MERVDVVVEGEINCRLRTGDDLPGGGEIVCPDTSH